ncbi:unnamed protein product [Adineta steineri]|uniref:LamG-like jellyroll fold domain-containing protein n=1 Tax=Adineta steineri TaxID=433720 RepID=A0A813VUD1_9BILA|nr:unnamed protein product [Adineta steineri]
MDTNKAYAQLDIEEVRSNKWWHHRWFKIACLCFIILSVLTITLVLLLKFVILVPEELDSTTTTTTTLSTVTTTSTSTSTSTSTTTTTTTTTPSTTTSTTTSISTTTTARHSGWSNTGNMTDGREMHTVSVLGNGKVLVTGGSYANTNLNTSELYDPSTGSWTSTGSMKDERAYHTATVLENGKVLVAGGFNGVTILNTVQLYDPSTETWTTTHNMNQAREEHTASLLADGRVLVTGGYNKQVFLDHAELYDPSTETWTTTGSMKARRDYHSATVLANGKVLVAGGFNGEIIVDTAELYDPATQIWTTTGNMDEVRDRHTASLLPNGKVLVAGGSNHDNIKNITTGKSTIVTSIFWAFNSDYKDVYNVYNGATTNGATFSSSVGITGYGSALSVPRTSSAYVSVFSPTLSLVNQSFTVAAWVYPTSTMYANDFPILVQCVTGADEKCFQALLRYGVPLLTFYYDDCNGVANFTANKWAHVAFVYDLSAKQQRIYVNGYLDSAHNSSGPYTGLGTSGLFIGGTTELNMYYDGLIDELSVDTRVKSASEILDIATLVLYYSFDSNTLTTDSGPNRINGTSVNAASALSGRVNSAISFQGNSSYFQANGLVLFGTSDLPYSFSLWINPGSVTSGILLFAWKNASWCLPVLGFTSAGHLYTTSKTSHNSTLLNSSSIIPTNVWTHVAHTYAPSTGIRLYINGTLSASSSAFNFSSTSSPISIALANCVNTTLCSCSTVPISMTPYNGLIDEFRFYSRALSATDVSSLANP